MLSKNFFSVHHHGSKFQTFEWLPCVTNSPVAIEDRTAVGQFDHECNQSKQWQKESQGTGGKRDIDKPLGLTAEWSRRVFCFENFTRTSSVIRQKSISHTYLFSVHRTPVTRS